MKAFILFASLVLAAVVSVNSKPTSQYKCCVQADQFEFMEGLVSGYLSDGGIKGSVSGLLKVSVDNSQEKKTAVDEHLMNNGTPLNVKVIIDHVKNIQYLVVNGNCTVQPAGEYHVCVPADATYNGRFVMGSPSGPFPTDSYSIKGDGFMSTITVTVDDCYPVGSTIQGHLNGASLTASIGYFNYTMGISDRSVFNIPSSCPHADEKDTILFGKNIPSGSFFTRHNLRLSNFRKDLD